MRVLVAEKFESSGIEALRALGCEVAYEPEVAAAELGVALRATRAVVLVVRGKKVGAASIEAGAGADLKLIVRAGAGYDSIDTAAAAGKCVAVCNCPGMNALAVAELVIGLLVCCDRRIPDQTIDLRNAAWRKKEYSKARGLAGSTLGVIGVGAIGRAVIRIAKAMGMRIVAHSIGMTAQRAQDLGVENGGSTRDDLYAMAACCDAISVHVAANAHSEKMCDAKFFAAMKSGAYFINTSRGSVVDEAALAEAIRSKGLRAGLDVFENEPSGGEASWSTPLAGLPGVYTAHHVGASTDQAQNAVAEEVVRVVKVFKDTGRAENRVN